MHASSWLRKLSLLAAASVVLAVGCKQGEGEPCEVESDCAEGFFCCQSDSMTDLPDFRGVCTADGVECDIARVPDAGPPRDAGETDAGEVPADAATDAGTDAGADAGTDAGTPVTDAGSDAGTDAGTDAG